MVSPCSFSSFSSFSFRSVPDAFCYLMHGAGVHNHTTQVFKKLQFSQLPNQHGTIWAVMSTARWSDCFWECKNVLCMHNLSWLPNSTKSGKCHFLSRRKLKSSYNRLFLSEMVYSLWFLVLVLHMIYEAVGWTCWKCGMMCFGFGSWVLGVV